MKISKNKLLCILLLWGICVMGQKGNDTKVILITLDGLRWQELFGGADSKLIANTDYVHDTTALKQSFWRDSPSARRHALMPFFWTEVVNMGELHGNRDLESKMNLTNKMWFSYPGYNEILTGKADDARIDSNDKFNNPNKTVLELYKESSKGKVAAFCSWDVFPFIINEERSGISVNAGFESATGNLSERETFLNQLQKQVPSPWGSVRLDAFTHHFALEYMKKEHPDLVYIAYGETDDFAHEGDYQAYLKSANNTDGMIKELWEFTQSDEFYRDKTTFIVTTDHGRGTQPLDTWTGHGSKVDGADEVWLVMFGKGIQTKGEVAIEEQLYTTQVAPTILNWLGLEIDSNQMTALPIK
ncbi:sulfatase-like hydrolase/transferase [Flagellimonas flava]|uniref:Phosphoglycerate mutase n=1 Tax=Flagellimonas flava TaxID=570519 RepID=A0A1M5MAA1_9FLAO|nr:sulfatase-like hydrolase/transferase [Allomuricauda flava]SHG74237.1 phosphoglycerate mutase [Allomuricauda flava]